MMHVWQSHTWLFFIQLGANDYKSLDHYLHFNFATHTKVGNKIQVTNVANLSCGASTISKDTT